MRRAGVNVVPLTSVVAEMEMPVVFEKPNVATSLGPFGTVAGVQLPARIPVARAGIKIPCCASGLRNVGQQHEQTPTDYTRQKGQLRRK